MQLQWIFFLLKKGGPDPLDPPLDPPMKLLCSTSSLLFASKHQMSQRQSDGDELNVKATVPGVKKWRENWLLDNQNMDSAGRP